MNVTTATIASLHTSLYNPTMISASRPNRHTPRRERIESAHVSAVMAGVVLAAGGWAGLIWLLGNTLPTVPNRWAFYVLLQVALTGTALPFVHFLNQRFGSERGTRVKTSTLVRQAIWVGLYGTLCVWLRIPRLLSIPLALLLALALATIETLLRLRERAQWRPD
jgi:hypothetical protein